MFVERFIQALEVAQITDDEAKRMLINALDASVRANLA